MDLTTPSTPFGVGKGITSEVRKTESGRALVRPLAPKTLFALFFGGVFGAAMNDRDYRSAVIFAPSRDPEIFLVAVIIPPSGVSTKLVFESNLKR